MVMDNNGIHTWVNIFNRTHPGAATGIITDYAGAKLSTTDKVPTVLKCNLCHSEAGVISYTRTRGATTKTFLLFGGLSVTAGVDMPFDIPYESGDSVDIFHSAASGTINHLIVREYG